MLALWWQSNPDDFSTNDCAGRQYVGRNYAAEFKRGIDHSVGGKVAVSTLNGCTDLDIAATVLRNRHGAIAFACACDAGL